MKILIILVLSITFLLSAVDINNADELELITLKGIGSQKAKAIINYRHTHCFKTIESLTDVKGIGVKTLEKNRMNLEVGKCKK